MILGFRRCETASGEKAVAGICDALLPPFSGSPEGTRLGVRNASLRERR